MSKGEKRAFFSVLVVLIIALGSMLLHSITGAGTPRVYQISILLDGSGDDYWQTFRKGVSQAALECNVDVRYISRYDSGGQSAVLKQEWEGETDGVVLIPIDARAVGEAWAKSPQSLAITIVGPELSADRAIGYASADNGEMGRRLADAVYADGWKDCVVVLSTSGSAATKARQAGFSARFGELGGSIEERETDDVSSLSLFQKTALVAMEPEVTEALCQRTDAAGRVYGVGSSNRLLRYLEDGQATALVVQSDYTAGYFSLLNVVDTLAGKPPKSTMLECYIATKDNLFTEPLIQLLFPIS